MTSRDGGRGCLLPSNRATLVAFRPAREDFMRRRAGAGEYWRGLRGPREGDDSEDTGRGKGAIIDGQGRSSNETRQDLERQLWENAALEQTGDKTLTGPSTAAGRRAAAGRRRGDSGSRRPEDRGRNGNAGGRAEQWNHRSIEQVDSGKRHCREARVAPGMQSRGCLDGWGGAGVKDQEGGAL